jgi:exopolysaccharide biosynthesis WecB/TagA/CpsF family protein
VLNDGSGVALAARLQGLTFPENLNGSDFNLRILELAARHGWPVFLLGAHPGVAERAASRLVDRLPGLTIAGTRNGYIDADGHAAVAAEIRESGASLLLVGMGNPLQERWLDEHLAATGCSIGVAVGAFIDFSAGEVQRAPRWMSDAGIEWMYRLRQEPRRLWRRYVLGNPAFVARVVRQRFRHPAGSVEARLLRP